MARLPAGLHFFPWTNPAANNCNTILFNGSKRILVDPGHAHLFGHVEEELFRLGLSHSDMDLVVITHAHPDHMEGIAAFAQADVPIALHADELAFIKSMAPRYGSALGIPDFEPHILLRDGELKAGTYRFQVIHSPGHSPGSICLYWPEERVLITGDVVFDQGIGRTDLPGGDGGRLKESIRRIARLDAAHLLPGHGGMISGEERVRTNFNLIEEYWFHFI